MTQTKNKMMRIGVIMAVVALVSMIGLAGTFAKYTTSETGTDSARVAKWGITLIATGNAFANAYKVGGEKSTSSTDAIIVKGESDAKVVAPGTKGSLLAVQVTGTPEVATHVTIDPATSGGKVVTLGTWTGDYCPLVFTKKDGSKIQQDGTTITTVAQLEQAINDYLETLEGKYEPGTAPTLDASLLWEWPFDADNTKDTALGNDTTANVNTIKLDMKVSVDQINTDPKAP
ncbi:MAG: hypothetical protein Q4E88_03035 [Coriobacteriia bacterium]|nr:hypothetical protein [Coriobacteriia bacterium]